MSGPALHIEGATRRFGDIHALAGVDAQICPGEWVALLGANGAGKTTLLRAVAGRVRLDEGSITVAGAPSGTAAARSRLGVVPQRIALYPHLGVAENLRIFARVQGVPRRTLRSRIGETLEQVGLAQRGNDAAGTLSGGMQRRLNIACGIIHRPQLVLLDEPTVGLDVASREAVHGLLRELQGRGVAILESTHELEAVEAACDRVLIMRAGRILAAGTVAELARAGRLTRHRCRLTLAQAPPDLELPPGFRREGDRVEGHLQAIAPDLAALLAQLADQQVAVHEVAVDPPDLEDVFVHFSAGGDATS